MSPKLPVVSARQVLKALRKAGWYVDYQRGSHIYLRNHSYPGEKITVPDHKEILPKTLASIIRQAHLEVEEFRSLL